MERILVKNILCNGVPKDILIEGNIISRIENNIDMSDFDKDGLDELNSTIMSELEKSNIKNEWKNHFEIEPFTFWKD